LSGSKIELKAFTGAKAEAIEERHHFFLRQSSPSPKPIQECMSLFTCINNNAAAHKARPAAVNMSEMKNRFHGTPFVCFMWGGNHLLSPNNI